MDTPCYLCGMKTKKWMMLAAGVIMTTAPLFAQFNTVMPSRTTGISESVSLKDYDMENRPGKAFMEGCPSEEKKRTGIVRRSRKGEMGATLSERVLSAP